MPKRVKISTKTTRNKEFNSYETGGGNTGLPYVINTVTSTTATKNTPNIKLLDVNEAITKKGSLIAEDTRNNTTIIEVSIKVDHKTAIKLYQYSVTPPPVGSPEYEEYKYYERELAEYGKTYQDINNWIINYKNGDSMNKTADIKFNSDNNYYIFGAPEQVVLNNRQHYNNCGIESTLNTLAMAGMIKMNENLKDQKKVENTFLRSVWERNLAGDSGEIGVLDQPDGGTLPDDYRDIMEYFGINSKSYYITVKSDEYVFPKAKINEFAYKISQGYGAVIGLSSDVLWHDAQSESGGDGYKIDHAIAITGVVYATDTPDENTPPVGFYIHDTGAWMTRFISYDDFLEATLCDYTYAEEDDMENKKLSTLKQYDSRLGHNIAKTQEGIFVTLTDEPIKIDTFNLNATGDKFDNMLWGNNSKNVLKGMAGNDVLYGRGGNDLMYGGAGNDVIVGNNAYKLKVKNNLNNIIFEGNTVSDFKTYLENAGVQDTMPASLLDKVELTDYGTLSLEEFVSLKDKIPNGINNIYGENGNDVIIGGEQADLIYGGSGNDYIYGGDGRNAIYGGAGHDVIIGGFDNDKLFGDAGNDYILGLEDEDVIDGGNGNDTIIGGSGSDMIETGKGNDVVCFEGTNFGQDEVSSKGGNTIFKFIDEKVNNNVNNASNALDMFFLLANNQENDKVKDLTIKYTPAKIEDDESQITFNDFLTVRSSKTKSLYLDAADGIYNVAVSNKAKATVLNTKTTGTTKVGGVAIKNEEINNVLITTNTKGTIITTSDKNDIVTMSSNKDKIPDIGIDKIAYTGGFDKYVSEERNTHYTTGAITNETGLLIYDNIVGLEKIIFDEAGYKAAIAINPNTNMQDYVTIDKNYVSTDDRLYFETANKADYLFDVGINGGGIAITTENAGLYLLNADIYDTQAEKNTAYKNMATENASNGFIYMEHFFKYDEDSDTQIVKTGNEYNFYGNGQIEGMYYKDNNANEGYIAHSYNADITMIASNVANWLNTYNQAHVGAELNSAYQAFATVEGNDLTNLVAAYNLA